MNSLGNYGIPDTTNINQNEIKNQGSLDETKIYKKEYPKNSINTIFAKFITLIGDLMVAANLGTTTQITSRIKNLDGEIGKLFDEGLSKEEIAQKLMGTHSDLFKSSAKLNYIYLNLNENKMIDSDKTNNINKILINVIVLKMMDGLKKDVMDILNNKEMNDRSKEYSLETLIKNIMGDDPNNLSSHKWEAMCSIFKEVKDETQATILHKENRGSSIDIFSTVVVSKHRDGSTTQETTTPYMNLNSQKYRH